MVVINNQHTSCLTNRPCRLRDAMNNGNRENIRSCEQYWPLTLAPGAHSAIITAAPVALPVTESSVALPPVFGSKTCAIPGIYYWPLCQRATPLLCGHT